MSKRIIQAGFTFVEVMTAVVIISISSVGLMMGAAHAHGGLRALEIRERATEELLNYTEYWKGRIADGHISYSEMTGNLSGNQIYLYGNANSDVKVPAKLFYDLTNLDSNTDFGTTSFRRIQLETWITWSNFSQLKSSNRIEYERRLETVMMEF